MTGLLISNFEAAIKLFESIPGWKDADEMVCACQKKIEEITAKAEADRLAFEHKKEIARQEAERIAIRKAKRNKQIAIIATSIVCAIVVFIIVLTTVILPGIKYNDAVALMEDGEYMLAAAQFESLNGFKDSKELAETCRKNEVERLTPLREKYGPAAQRISAGGFHTVGLKADGTVVAVGDNDDGQCDVQDWTDIVAVAAGFHHTVGLKADGTLVAVGYNEYGRCDVGSWKLFTNLEDLLQ